jgi:hypothetical protein
MKKITLIVFTGILISVFFSCTPESVLNGSEDINACCVDEGTIELPPPPPPKDGDGD